MRLRSLRQTRWIGLAVAAAMVAVGPTASGATDATSGDAPTRLAGTDRYATAVAVADSLFPDGARVAVVAAVVRPPTSPLPHPWRACSGLRCS